MPQMSPLLWTNTIILTMNLLLIISSFTYFMYIPNPHHIITPPNFPFSYHSSTYYSSFKWLW